MSATASNVQPKFNLQARLMNAVHVHTAELKQKSEKALETAAEPAVEAGVSAALSNNTKSKKTIEDFPNLKQYMEEENCETLEDALFSAIDCFRVDIIKDLAQCDVNVNAIKTGQHYAGATPLSMTLTYTFVGKEDGQPMSREDCIQVMDILVKANADINCMPPAWFTAVDNVPFQSNYLDCIVEHEKASANFTAGGDPKLNILRAFLKYKPRVTDVLDSFPRGKCTVFSRVLSRVYDLAYNAPSHPETPAELRALKMIIDLLVASDIQNYEEIAYLPGLDEDNDIYREGSDFDVVFPDRRSTRDSITVGSMFYYAMILIDYPYTKQEHADTVSAIAKVLVEDIVLQILTGVYPEYKRLLGTREEFKNYCVRIFAPSHINSPHAKLAMKANISDKAWNEGEYLTDFGSIVRNKLSTYHNAFSPLGGPAQLVLEYCAAAFDLEKPRPSAHPALIFSIMQEGAWPKKDAAKKAPSKAMVVTTSTTAATAAAKK